MSKPGTKDIESIRDTIKHTGEFRVHLIYSRSGLMTKCKMWHHDGHTVGVAHGGGYDKGGAALGQAIELFFAEELKGLRAGYLSAPEGGAEDPGGLYGLTRFPGGRVSLNGACGKEQMLKVLVALGFTDCNLYETGKLSSMVVARKAGGSARPAPFVPLRRRMTPTDAGYEDCHCAACVRARAAILNGREG